MSKKDDRIFRGPYLGLKRHYNDINWMPIMQYILYIIGGKYLELTVEADNIYL